MTLDILDVLLVAHFCFAAPVPWWLWALGIVNTILNMR